MRARAFAVLVLVGCQSRPVVDAADAALTPVPVDASVSVSTDAGDAATTKDAATKTCATIPATCAAMPASPDASITLRRGACFGTCPVYSVTVSADGTVKWIGEDHVTRRGAATGKVDPKEAKALFDFATSACFFETQSAYTLPMLDLPSVDLSMKVGEHAQNVRIYPADPSAWSRAECKPPAALLDLPARIDTLAGTAKWIGHR